MYTDHFTTENGILLNVDCHLTSLQRRETAILYFHGGGLLYGSRNDLPSSYLELFLSQGYDVLCFDYPLAPESSIDQIHIAVLSCLKWFLGNHHQNYYLFGRSAGAYLALYLAHSARITGLPAPLGILSFYGYPGLLIPEFSVPNANYAKLHLIDESAIKQQAAHSDAPVTNGPLNERYFLYVYARQSGKWIEMLCNHTSKESASLYSLTPEDLALLPPTFLTASSSDHDVPFGVSKRMARQIPNSHFHPVYHLEHDFDRNTSRPESQEVYKAALKWMDKWQ